MSLNLKLLGTEISISSANTVSTAKLVRVFNSNTTAPQVITIKNGSGSTIANVTIAPLTAVFVNKEPTDTVAGSDLLAVSVAFTH